VVLSEDSRSSEKFMHGIKVLMARNYIDNLGEEVRKGMIEKARQGHWPTVAPVGYQNNRSTHRSSRSRARADRRQAVRVVRVRRVLAEGGEDVLARSVAIDARGRRPAARALPRRAATPRSRRWQRRDCRTG
jgi:DNA invertase Pin-like site-specific DNA recombinase